jgi:hypothetical protein
MSNNKPERALKAIAAALLRKFHGDQIPGEFYRPAKIYHSIYGRGGEQANLNPLTQKPCGSWLGRSR